MCQQRAQWAGIASNRKQCLWQRRGLRRRLAGSAVPLLWLQSLGATAQTPNGWGSRKNRRPVRDFLREKCAKKKCLPFRRNMGLKTRKNISDHFLRFLVLVRLQGLFLKISYQGTFFSAVSLELAMLPACDPSLSTKCALSKSSKALERVLVVPAWQGTLHENNLENIEKISWRGSAPGVVQGLWGGKPCPAELFEGVNRGLSNFVWRHSPANSPDTICWTLFRYTWGIFLLGDPLRSLSGSLNCDWRYYSCDWPHLTQLPSRGQLELQYPSLDLPVAPPVSGGFAPNQVGYSARTLRYLTLDGSGKKERAQRLSFWVRRPPGGVGVFHAKGWWLKTSCPPSKLPWVSKKGIRDVPGILPGCPGPLAVFKKFVQKNFVRIFHSLMGENTCFKNRHARVETRVLKTLACQKNAFKHSYTVECGNRLRVGVRAKNASVSGFACRPF